MFYIVKKWDAGIRGTCLGGDGVGGVWCGAGGVVGCGLGDIYSFTSGSDLIIPGLVTNGTAKICCRGLILVLFNSTMVIKNSFG